MMEPALAELVVDDRAFSATLAFLEEYDADIDLDLDELPGAPMSPGSSTTTPTTSASDDVPSEVDGENSDGAISGLWAAPVSVPEAAVTTHRRQANKDPTDSTSTKTTVSGTYPSQMRKQELEILRSKVLELEEKLRVLKRSTTPSVDRCCLTEEKKSQRTSSSSASVATEGRGGMWEEVAMLQFEQRRQAQNENARLRGLLESQIKLAHGLERLLKRSNVDLHLPANRIKRARRTEGADEDLRAFDELMTVIDDMYGQLDVVFADEHFEREDGIVRDIAVDDDPHFGTVVDIFDARNLPFAVRPTADAVWGYFVNAGKTRLEDQIEVTDDHLRKHFSFIVEVNRYQATFRGRLAGRRFFEEGRIVILWVAMIEPEVAGTDSQGMVVRQKGWTIIKRPKHLPVGCMDETIVTRIQSKHVAIPYVYEDVPEHKRKAGTLTNFVLHSVYSHLQTSRKMIENLLIEGAMKTR